MGVRTLKEHRREVLGIRQRQMAALLETSQGHVSQVESGHLPNPFDLKRWAKKYELSATRFRELVVNARDPNWGLPLWEMVKQERPAGIEPFQASARPRVKEA